MPRATEIPDPQGGRCRIREGDLVHVRPSRPGRRDGFDATFRAAVTDDNGTVREIEVYGGRAGRGAIRTLAPERIQRRAQTRHRQPQ